MVREVDRRSVLKRVGVAGVVGAGLATGTATACEENGEVEMSSEQMAAELEVHAEGVLESLYTKELISEPAPEALPLERRSLVELAAGGTGATAVEASGDTYVIVTETLEDARLRLFANITQGFSNGVYDEYGNDLVGMVYTTLPVDWRDLNDENPCGNHCINKNGCESEDGDFSGIWRYKSTKNPKTGCLPATLIHCMCHTQEVPERPEPEL